MKKILSFLLLFFLFASADAQKANFFRVYNLKGKKINKGEIFQLSDTSIILTRRNMFVETPISQIDVIKSKRTTGHRVLKTTLVVVVAVVVLAGYVAALARTGPRYGNTPDFDSFKHEKLRSPRQKPTRPQKKYKVNSDAKKWQEQRKLLAYQRV